MAYASAFPTAAGIPEGWALSSPGPLAYIRVFEPGISDADGWLTDTSFSPGEGLLTYRLEAAGTTVRFLIDGQLVLETTDPRISTGGGVELFNYGAEATVRAIRVVAL